MHKLLRYKSALLLAFWAFIIQLASVGCFAQPGADSLQAIWKNELNSDSIRFSALNLAYKRFTFSHPDAAQLWSHDHYALAIQTDNNVELTNALNERALSFYVRGKVDSAMALLYQALEVRQKMKDTLGMALLQVNIGSLHRERGSYKQAVREFTQALGLFEHRDTAVAFRADILNNLGLIYDDIGMHEVAEEYLNQALELYEVAELDEEIGNIWLNLGAAKAELGQPLIAMDYLRKAERILLVTDNRWSLADCYHTMASIYFKNQQNDSAIAYVDRSLALNRELGNERKALTDLSLRAKLLLDQQSDEAFDMAKQIDSLLPSEPDKAQRALAYDVLYQCYKRQGRTAEALNMLEHLQMLTDSIQQDEDHITVVRETIKNEYEWKLFAEQLENEKEQADLRIRQIQIVYGITFAGLLSILLVIAYARRRISLHRKQQQELLKELEELKESKLTSTVAQPGAFALDRSVLEHHIGRPLNETDWKVLNLLMEDPVISNKDLAQQAFLSVDGIGSSLRRMYELFNVKESKYKKISLLMEAIRQSNSPNSEANA